MKGVVSVLERNEEPPCEKIVVYCIGVFKFLWLRFFELDTDGWLLMMVPAMENS